MSNQMTVVSRGLRVVRLLPVCMALGVLAACVQQPKPMYSWQAYEPTVYAYLKDDGADYAAQAQVLEQNVETARSANVALPPGFRAHLGMLYLKMGEDSKAVEQLQGEKLAFPEGSPFMDFLLRNTAKPDTKSEPSLAEQSSAGKAVPSTPVANKSSGKRAKE